MCLPIVWSRSDEEETWGEEETVIIIIILLFRERINICFVLILW